MGAMLNIQPPAMSQSGNARKINLHRVFKSSLKVKVTARRSARRPRSKFEEVVIHLPQVLDGRLDLPVVAPRANQQHRRLLRMHNSRAGGACRRTGSDPATGASSAARLLVIVQQKCGSARPPVSLAATGRGEGGGTTLSGISRS